MWNMLEKDLAVSHADGQFRMKKGRSFPGCMCWGQKWDWISHHVQGGDRWAITLGAGIPNCHPQPEGFRSPRLYLPKLPGPLFSGWHGGSWGAENGPWLHAALSPPRMIAFWVFKAIRVHTLLEAQEIKKENYFRCWCLWPSFQAEQAVIWITSSFLCAGRTKLKLDKKW